MTTTRASTRRHCGHPRAARSLPAWAHGWAFAGIATPAIGLAAADIRWVLGLPIAVLTGGVRAAGQTPGPVFAVLIVVLPVLGGLLAATTGRPQRVRPPLAGAVRRPALFAVGAVTTAAAVYGLVGSAVVGWTLATSSAGLTATFSDLRAGWATTGTVVLVVAWTVCLGVVTIGWRSAARPVCERCEPAAAGVVTDAAPRTGW